VKSGASSARSRTRTVLDREDAVVTGTRVQITQALVAHTEGMNSTAAVARGETGRRVEPDAASLTQHDQIDGCRRSTKRPAS
jgi:hypothetical protein